MRAHLEKEEEETTGGVNTSILLLGKFLNGKNLFNDQFHIFKVHIKENTNLLKKIVAVLFFYYCFLSIYYIRLKDDCIND